MRGGPSLPSHPAFLALPCARRVLSHASHFTSTGTDGRETHAGGTVRAHTHARTHPHAHPHARTHTHTNTRASTRTHTFRPLTHPSLSLSPARSLSVDSISGDGHVVVLLLFLVLLHLALSQPLPPAKREALLTLLLDMESGVRAESASPTLYCHLCLLWLSVRT